MAIFQKMQSQMVGSINTDQGNESGAGWLERKGVVGVGGFAVGEHVVAVDVLQEHRDLLLGIGQAGFTGVGAHHPQLGVG